MIDAFLNALTVLKPYLGDSQLLFSIAVGITVALLMLSVLYLLFNVSSPVRRRLQNARGNVTTSTVSSRVDRAVQPLKPLIMPKSDKELSTIRRRLVNAGYRSREAVTVYYAIKLLLVLLLALFGAVAGYWFYGASSREILFSILAGAMLGILLPSYVLDKKVKGRQERIINAFPDVLDLLVACSEAGLGLNAALQRVSRETRTLYPDLSGELELVNAEIRAGVDRVQALRSLSTRTGVDDVSGFVSMISQSVRFGTSIADTLRIYAEVFREKRMARAEEQAAKVATKLIFPLVFCIFPSFFVVAIGPAVLAIVKAFATVSAGQ